jgi:curved DNA-binding protein
MTDYYQTLGVDRNATPEEIKKAYRSLASKHHPDKGGDTNKFQDIQVAYETLSDPEKKAQYDNPQPQGFPGGFHFHAGGMPSGFDDILSQMFGGHHPFGHRQPPRNKTLNIQTSISLEEAFRGKDLLANLTLPSGREQTIEVKIPAGIQDGTTLRLQGLGDDSIPNMPRGDLHLTILVLPHNIYRRQGDDLIRSVEITCIEAMLGKNILIDTLGDKTLEISISPGTQPGQILNINGYGMPKASDNRFKGRLMIQVNITVPLLTDEQKRLLTNFFN